MLTLIPFDDSRVVGARISGKITRPEFNKMVEKLEAALNSHGKVRVYVELEGFGGVAMDSLLEDLKFGIRHWNDVDRKVVVSTRTGFTVWRAWLPACSAIFRSRCLTVTRNKRRKPGSVRNKRVFRL